MKRMMVESPATKWIKATGLEKLRPITFNIQRSTSNIQGHPGVTLKVGR